MDPEADAPLVTDLACSPTDPTFACATSDYAHRKASLALWNMRAFKKAHAFALPPACAITSACFSPDGHQLVAAGAARVGLGRLWGSIGALPRVIRGWI